MTKKQLFKKEYAQELQRIAHGDYESALGMFESKKGRPENVCYLAQQAIEKSLKAMICHLEKPIPFTHSIEVLLTHFPDDIQPPGGEDLVALTDFAMIRRYNESNEIISDEDMRAVLNASFNLLGFIDQQLKK